ncbi:hypothetical protein ECTW15901_4561, partial [Escherichia coli TW15901]
MFKPPFNGVPINDSASSFQIDSLTKFRS